jgi:hypothetical protein
MTCFRRTMLSGLLAVVAALVVGVSFASAAGTLDIYSDYKDNRVIDGHYPPSDLKAALTAADGDTSYDGFAAAVQDAYDRDILGLSVGGEAEGAREFGDATPTSSLLPEPRGPGARDQPPWPFLALSILAGALVVTGAGSSIYRRARR